jgi:tRNA A37 threonylcarbamoyladenosine dehydratase
MADLHSGGLEDEYAAAAERARRTVAAAFDLHRVGTAALPDGVDRGRFRDVWRVRPENGAPVAHLLVAIPWVFPDELPDIYSPEDLTFEGARIPHVDGNRQVCTLDDSTRFPNPEFAGEAVIEVIERAVQIIQDGVAGRNKAEYWDEFEAYWIDGAKNLTTAVAIVRAEGPHRRVVSIPLLPKLGVSSLLFAEDDTTAFDFLDVLGRLPQKPPSRPALYLHLDAIGETPNLRTNADVKRCLPADAYKELLCFLQEDERPSAVLFSIAVGNDRVFGGWVHEQYATTVYKGAKSRKIMGQAPGFRPGHLPPDTELTSAFGGQRVGRIVVRRADADRLVRRTVGRDRAATGGVNVIGCGSVGGFVARAFAHSGPSPLRLIDSEDLEVHNVPRHVCDLVSVGLNKAEAVRRLLRRSDPHLQVEALTRDVREILRTDVGRLLPAHLSIVAIANVAVERRINELARSIELGTVACVWIEPHAIAGHAVVVPPNVKGCFECLVGPEGKVNVAVLDKPEAFTRADAGCRGSFVPYGGVDLETFATTIARETAQAKVADAGAIITWVGNLDEARRNGWAIDPAWAAVPNYSIHRRDIAPRSDCRICAPS